MGIARVSRAVASWAGLRKPSGRLALRAYAAGACHRLQREVHEDSTRRELPRFGGKGGVGVVAICWGDSEGWDWLSIGDKLR